MGRIYIALNDANPDNRVIRIDDITSSSYTEIVPAAAGGGGVKAIAIDRQNNYIYYTRGSDLFFKTIGTAGAGTSLNVGGFTSTSQIFVGIDIDNDGFLYIAESDANEVRKYNPSTESVVGSAYTNQIALEWGMNNESRRGDLMVKSDYLYIANPDNTNASGYKIIQLDIATMTFVDSYGSDTNSQNTNPGMFYNPRMFVATLNETFYIIDETQDGSDNQLDKLVSMEDINGVGWDTFTPSEIAEDPFEFFNQC